MVRSGSPRQFVYRRVGLKWLSALFFVSHWGRDFGTSVCVPVHREFNAAKPIRTPSPWTQSPKRNRTTAVRFWTCMVTRSIWSHVLTRWWPSWYRGRYFGKLLFSASLGFGNVTCKMRIGMTHCQPQNAILSQLHITDASGFCHMWPFGA